MLEKTTVAKEMLSLEEITVESVLLTVAGANEDVSLEEITVESPADENDTRVVSVSLDDIAVESVPATGTVPERSCLVSGLTATKTPVSLEDPV